MGTMIRYIIILDDETGEHWIRRGSFHASQEDAQAAEQYDGTCSHVPKATWTERGRAKKHGGIYNTAAQQQEAPAWIVRVEG